VTHLQALLIDKLQTCSNKCILYITQEAIELNAMIQLSNYRVHCELPTCDVHLLAILCLGDKHLFGN